MLDEKLLVFVLGAPGAGKGTQCDLIVKEYGWTHFSAGDLLRAQVKAGTEMGKKAEEYLKAGTMVPASMIIGLLKEALSDAQHTKVLIDGFPRVLDQLKEFEQEVRPCNTALFYNVPEEEAKQRLLKRGQTSGRVDDNEETIHNRFIVFKQESMPVISELEREGRAVEIDAAQSPEQVFAATRKVIEQLEQQQASKAKQPVPAAAAEAPTPAAVAAEAEAVGSAVQSPKAPVLQASLSPAAAAAAAGFTPVSPQAAPVAAASPTAVQAAAAGSASGTPAGGSPVAAAAAASGATSSTAAAAAGAAVPALAALAAGAAAVAVTSSPVKSPTAQATDTAAAAAAPGSPDKAVPAIVVPAAVAGVPPHLDVTSPTAAGAVSPSPRATLASLHVDLSGIRTPIIICGPSGVGKGTLISKLMEQHPDRFGFSVSHTTRGPRPGEVHGKHYYFTERESMAAQVAAGMFLEHANVHGNMYGTSLAAVAQVSAAGKHCVLDIDVQGAAQVRKSALGPHCLFIFVAPPSHKELERRLRHRGTETEDKVLQRLANAESEIAKAQEPGLFHHVLVNADLEVAYQELQKVIGQRVPGLLAADGSSQPAAAAAAGTVGSSSQRTSEAGLAAAAPAASAPTAAAAAAQNGIAAPAPAGVSPVAVAAGAGGMAAVAAAAATAAVSPRTQQLLHQQQQQAAVAAHQAHPHQPALANGNASAAVSAAGGTSMLLDFGFGASAGPAVAAKGMPVRQYMDATVIPVLRDGLKALNAARPDDPLQFLADFLVAHKAAAA